MVDAATIEKLEAGFSKLQASDSKSLLKKYLTKDVFEALKNKKTSFGSTLLDCIQSGKFHFLLEHSYRRKFVQDQLTLRVLTLCNLHRSR